MLTKLFSLVVISAISTSAFALGGKIEVKDNSRSRPDIDAKPKEIADAAIAKAKAAAELSEAKSTTLGKSLQSAGFDITNLTKAILRLEKSGRSTEAGLVASSLSPADAKVMAAILQHMSASAVKNTASTYIEQVKNYKEYDAQNGTNTVGAYAALLTVQARRVIVRNESADTAAKMAIYEVQNQKAAQDLAAKEGGRRALDQLEQTVFSQLPADVQKKLTELDKSLKEEKCLVAL